jgi:sulfopyruvate decarboxylase subunit alpha
MIRAELILQELAQRGVTHVAGLPDNSSAKLFDLLAPHPEMKLINVTREGEAFAIAAGLWLGGKKPAVLIQNTGFLESGDGFRGTVMRMRVPLVCFVTYRGFRKMPRGLLEYDEDMLSRAELDSVALVTEPTLKAWGVPFWFLHGESDLPRIADAFRRAEEHSQPVAVLITTDLG